MSEPGPAPEDRPWARAGPLRGLRVVDLTGDLGRFATKLLAEHGAEVCRPHHAGSRGAPMRGPAGDHGGVLDWWFDGAKVPIELDLATTEGRDRYRRLATAADLVVEAMPVGFLADNGIDHEHILSDNPGLTQVSLTPFGRTGPRAGWHTSDLVAGSLGGVVSVTGLPERPLNSWGGQSFNFGGFCAALCGLAGVRAARRTGHGQLVDLSLHEVVTGSVENLFMQYFYDDHLDLPKVARRQGSLHWLGAYQVVPARTGNVMVTPTPNAEALIQWMIASGVAEAAPFDGLTVEELLSDMPGLMAAMTAFAADADSGWLFTEAQARHIAFGQVQTVAQVAANPQFEHRRFLHTGDCVSPRGETVAVSLPGRLVRFDGTPTEPPGPPATATTDLGALVDAWLAEGPAPGRAEATAPGARPSATGDGTGDRTGPTAGRPLDDLVVLDLSWVLAGPFGTRLLGDLGADVIKLQTEERATLVNRPDHPYYPVWNRSKRSVTLDLKHPKALAVIRRLVERADVLVENYSSGVLERLGLGWASVSEWNDRLVYISMSGCGHDGPWSEVISYAPTIHALGGLTHLTNPTERGDIGCGFSLNDHAAGFAAAFSVLAALEDRERTGRGQYLDMAQLEVGAYLLGPALVDYTANGRVATPAGNVDGLTDLVPNEVYLCRDGRHVAVTAVDDDMWLRLAGVVGCPQGDLASVELRRIHRHEINHTIARWCDDHTADAAMRLLQATGVAAGVVQDAEDLAERDPQHVARRFWLDFDHQVFGPRRHDRFPGLWSDADLGPYRPPPNYLGEANFEVWTEFAGLDAAEVAEGMGDGLFS